MRRRVYLTGVLVGILLFPLPFAVADPPLNELYLRIYLKINDAEQLEKQGDYRGALDDFKDCYSNLDKIHQEDPDWESALVIKRMEDCKQKIVDLQARVDAMPPPIPPSAPDTVQPGMAPVPTDSDTAVPDADLNDVDSLKARLQAVEEKLKQTEASLSDSQAQVETFQDRLVTVNQELQALKNKPSVDDRVGRLLSENKELTDKLTEAEKQIDDFKTNPTSKLALVQTQLKNLQDQFDESQAANTTLQQTITTLQQRLDQAQADLVEANQKASTPGPDSAEYTTIKRENEVMRAILQREIQEQARRDIAKQLIEEEFDTLKLKSQVLQEHLDEATTVMTPPTTDEERALIDSLKVPGPDVEAAPGNNLSVTAADAGAPAAATTNVADNTTPPAAPSDTSSTPPAPTTPTAAPDAGTTTPAASDNSTNTPPVTIANNDTTPAPTTPDSTTTTPATTNVADNTTSPAAPPDTSSTPPAPTTPDSTATTNVADNTTPPTAPPDAPSTSPGMQAPSNTDPPTVTQVPAGTTTVTDTSITHGDPNSQPDPTQYSTKARLPDEMRDTAQQAADLFKNGRYDEAAAKYQEIIDKYPESLYAWSNLGVVRFQQGKLDEALKALQQAVKLSPTDAFSYSNLGIVYYQLNQYENAIDALNSAKALDPNDAKTRNYLGCACSQKGWQEVAEKEFRKAIELDPDFGDAHFNLALVYATEKPPLIELARQEYKKALDLGITKDDRLEKLLQAEPPAQPQAPTQTQTPTDTGANP